jgi:hypothetical protein
LLPIAWLAASACTTVQITGHAAATSVPRPVLFGPVQVVGGGQLRTSGEAPVDVDLWNVQLASYMQTREKKTVGLEQVVTTTSQRRSSPEELGVSILVGVTPHYDVVRDTWMEKDKDPHRATVPLRPTDVFTFRRLDLSVLAVDVEHATADHVLVNASSHGTSLNVLPEPLEVVRLAPSESR